VSARHALPSTQAGQNPPPQSASVSTPSWRWSWHCGVTHVSDTESHAKLEQSASATHFLPLAQGGQAPPQATSVQEPLMHSWEAEQICPALQSLACRHGTHFPAPSHQMPPPAALHAVPAGAGAVPEMPALLQVPRMQGFVGVGTLFWSTTEVPAPHAIVAWQSGARHRNGASSARARSAGSAARGRSAVDRDDLVHRRFSATAECEQRGQATTQSVTPRSGYSDRSAIQDLL